ncbi:MAG: anti-sigma factor domain-containing protein, partial [Clostridiaceae bacterium]|nr:anti-sigma factor domain-containing protein [Clostridiaceae bacterium]
MKNGRVIVMTKQFDFVEIKRKPQMASGQKISFKQ